MARPSSIHEHFDLYLTPVTLTFNLPEKKCFKWRFSSSRATTVQVMARTSSIHVFDHFDLYLTPVTLTFDLPKYISNGTCPPQGQQLCQIVFKSMHYCTSYCPDKSGRTHGCTHIHRTKIVTTMSHLPASGLDKN